MSISDLAELPDKLLPPDDADPRAIKRYRLRTALVACSAFLTVAVIVLPAMFVGLPKVGQIAWAGEVDDKIAAALSPVLAEQRAQSDLLKEMRTDQLTDRIRELHAIRCKADAQGRARADREIEAAQLKYFDLNKQRYPLPACEDL